MLLQLGNIVFKGLLGPSSFSVEGLEAIYAEHQLLSGKSKLQPTGTGLEEITMEVLFHAEFCRPDQQLRFIKDAINDKTVLPLLLGNGRVLNDYVVITAPYRINEMLPDGTAKSITLTLTIREFISQNKLEKKELQGYQAAFAIGDKSPVSQRSPQPESIEKQIGRNISATRQQSRKIDDLVTEYEKNPSKRQALGKQITNACQKANDHIADVNDQLNDAREVESKFTGIRGAVSNMKTTVNGVANLYPFDSPTALLTANGYLQSASTTLGSTSAPLLSLIATRQTL